MHDKQKEYFTTDELAKLLRVSRTTILRYIDEGLIKAIRIGRTVRIPAAEVRRLTNTEEKQGPDGGIRAPEHLASVAI